MMRTGLLMSSVAALVLAPTLALAQASTTTGMAGGAAAGAAVGGPVGAVVGGVVGGTLGAAADISDDVIDTVEDLDDDDVQSVYVREPVVVGERLPRVVVLRPIPQHNEYRYTVVNDQRLIVEPRTRRVVRIVD